MQHYKLLLTPTNSTVCWRFFISQEIFTLLLIHIYQLLELYFNISWLSNVKVVV